jgi:hypothetical protein
LKKLQTYVVLAVLLGRHELVVIGATRGRVNPATSDTLDQHLSLFVTQISILWRIEKRGRMRVCMRYLIVDLELNDLIELGVAVGQHLVQLLRLTARK